jgi:hypothetical protein
MYGVLESLVADALLQPSQTLVGIVNTLSDNAAIGWDTILEHERSQSTWPDIRKWPKYHIIKRLVPNDRFPRGGDRSSAAYRVKMALVQHVRDLVVRATPDVDEHELADTVIEDVSRRFAPRPAQRTDFTRYIRRLVSTVRRWTTTGADGTHTVEEECELFTEEVVERAFPNDNDPEHPGPTHDTWLQTVLMPLEPVARIQALLRLRELDVETTRAGTDRIAAEKERIQAETARLEAAVTLDRIRIQAEADILRIRAQSEADTLRISRKRPAPEVSVEERIEERSGWPYRGRLSLSARIWEARPVDCRDDIRTVFRRVCASAPTLVGPQTVRRALAGFNGIEIVYVDADCTVDELVRAFWAGGVPAVVVPRMEAPRRRALPPGVSDLAAAVVGVPPDDAPAYLAAVRQLDAGFCVPNAERWAVLWPARHRDPRLLPTYIDVERDPIVGQLREWMQNGAVGPAPPYPAVGEVDLRPAEPVPSILRAMDSDVWPTLQVVGLERACAKLLSAYRRSQSMAIPAADAPCDERIRQFRRLTSDGSDELAYRQIAECLGWIGAMQDVLAVRAITEALMLSPLRRGGPVPTAAWYVKRGGVAQWRWRQCLWEMRTAAVFVTRLNLGGADLAFLARDVARFAPPQPTATKSSN